MHRRNTARLCEWAELVGADLPDEIVCDQEDGSPAREELRTEQ